MQSSVNPTEIRSRKKIGFIHYTLPPAISGVEMVIRDHARLLSSLGYKIYLLGASGKKFRSEIDVQISRGFDPKDKNVRLIQEELKNNVVSKTFYTKKKRYETIIRKWIEKNKLDTVIIHNVLSRHYNLAMTAAIVEIAHQYKDKVRFINWVHDASFIDMSYTRVSTNLADKYPWNLISTYQKDFIYVTISKTRKTELHKLYGVDKKIIVVNNGLDLNKMLPLPLQTRLLFKEMIERDPDYIGLIPVRIAERKNIEFAIELAKTVRDDMGIKLMFVVTGALHLQNLEAMKYFEMLKQKIKDYKLESQVFFLYNYKFANGDKFDIYKLNVRDLYIISDFLFLPSKSEGFGLPILEAGFIRIPIFVSSLPVFREVGNGYINLIDINAPIKDTINLIFNYLRKSRSTTFHKTILKQFALEAIVKNQIVPLLENR